MEGTHCVERSQLSKPTPAIHRGSLRGAAPGMAGQAGFVARQLIAGSFLGGGGLIGTTCGLTAAGSEVRNELV